MTYDVRRIAAGEWRELRALRLEALRTAPDAFGSTYAREAAFADSKWQERVERSANSDVGSIQVVIGESRDWVGLAAVGVTDHDPTIAHVYSVYVSPDHRGSAAGLAGRLMEALTLWTREHTAVELLVLDVHEDNGRARAFYRRLGYTETGATQPFMNDPTKLLIEMSIKILR